ncbi:monosaccharide ABC transporter membrane protein (CUT2 family) [Hydrogenispora ethanolica]|uniref:Monosaccharide ABC transporter membrane protein (CUT2 family) n=1 Tax=Hydrogenispora ethanolica TaxID=1082276 RepID=A0A4R1SAN5_HYDET|nr:ABC transporter permease [Hydrogenispora ethanolica]TCL76284.1 monosaccharide ABC transporter membrane protein (CUT2 family) [Hydrogenispora ethanolica]
MAVKEEPSRSAPFSVWQNLKQLAPFLILLAMGSILTVLSPYFLTVDNLLAIGVQMAVIGIMVIGEMIVLIASGIDFSVGSVLALGGVISSVLLVKGVPEPLCILAGVLASASCGFVNGFLISKGKLPPFIATLGMMGVARGLALVISDGGVIFGFPKSFSWWGMGTIFGRLPVPIFLMAIVAFIGYLVLRYTRFGRLSYAIGSNMEATRLSGIQVDNYLMGYYTLSGLLAGFAGVVLSSRLNTGQPTAGSGYELDVIAACVMGGVSLRGGVGTVLGAIIGGLIMGLLRNGSNLLNISAFWQQVLVGVVIIGAVFWDQYRQRRPNSKNPTF